MDLIDSVLDDVGVQTEDTSETNKKLYAEGKEVGMDMIEPKEKEKQHKIFYGLSTEDRHVAVQKHIVPQAYEHSAFNIDKVRDNIKRDYARSNRAWKVYKLNEYENICYGILSSIRMKKLPARSYLIGAPNGFGKTSFVNECLITLNAHGFRVTPYISLTELAELRVEDEKEALKSSAKVRTKFIVEKDGRYYDTLSDDSGNEIIIDEYVKRPDKLEKLFSFKDYINCDCLFTYFTDDIAKKVESQILYQLLQIRGAKGLPTIVMISRSTKLYLMDLDLKRFIWDEILAYDEEDGKYDRIYHISCYKMPRQGKLGEKGENIESDTGIVH